MCIPRQALLGGLLSRISREGHRPSPDELRSLLAAGLSATEIADALRRLGTDEAMDGLVQLETLVGGGPGRGDR
jgi:hypothetical protein